MNETPILRKIMLAIGKLPDVRVWRNNVGVAIYKDGSRVAYGLCSGSSDIIGIKTVTITPDMVGKEIGVFVAIEVKDPKNKRKNAKQDNFRNVILKRGGIAGKVHSVDEAEELIL